MSEVVWGCLLAVFGCGIDPTQSPGAVASGGAGGSSGTTAAGGGVGGSEGGVAGGAAGAAATTSWSCGVAAGACTCVRVEVPLTDAECPASDCCFVDPAGDCTCRLGDPAPACDELMRAFGATESVSECPL